METVAISLRDLSHTSVMVLALALASLVYLARLRGKSSATRWLVSAYASFTVAAFGLFVAASVVPTGYALWPLEYAAALAGLASLMQFAYRFPEADQPHKARGTLAASGAVIVLAVGFTLVTAYQVLSGTAWRTGLEETFPLLLPAGTLAGVAVFLQRAAHFTLAGNRVRIGVARGAHKAAQAIVRPPNRAAQTHRNFAIGVGLALPAGVAYPLTDAGVLPCAAAALLLSVGLIVSLAWILLTYLSNGSEPTSFIVKLIVVSLVVSLVVFSGLGPWVTWLLDTEYVSAKRLELQIVAGALRAAGSTQNLRDLPDAVVYVAACPTPCAEGCFACGARPIYVGTAELAGDAAGASPASAREALGFMVAEDAQLRRDAETMRPIAHSDTYKLIENSAWSGQTISLRYASNPLGSVYEYMGLGITAAGTRYEIGFPLAEYRRLVHDRTLVLVVLVAASSAAILVVFPLFLRTNLVNPLQALLEGVRQVNAGNLDVAVPMQMGDEIGFLAYSFTGMVASLRKLDASLRKEVGERRRAEHEIRSLYETLEQRVAEQTRELSALFNVSAAAGQALNLATLVERSMEHTSAAIESTAGMIYLRDEVMGRLDSPWLHLAAQRGIPKRLVGRIARLPARQELIGWVIEHKEPLLVPNLFHDPRTPESLRLRVAWSAVLAPLRAGGQVLGLFVLLRRRDRTFDQEEVALLSSIADQVGIAVEGYQLRRVAEQTAVLKERQRLSRDLHDSITQYLYSLNLLAEAGQAQLETGAVASVGTTFAQIGRTARQALKEIRLFIQQLRPPALEQVGLVGALHQRLASVEGRASVQTRLLVDEAIVLPVATEEALYHIASEALNNTLKHADADTVTVHLKLDGDRAVLTVLDNGRGFDQAKLDGSGVGLDSMNERAGQVGGTVEITSTPGTGTLVRATVPLVPIGAEN